MGEMADYHDPLHTRPYLPVHSARDVYEMYNHEHPYRRRKQTKIWKTSDGRKIRICDMDDGHLYHSIAYLERMAKEELIRARASGEQLLNILQGEIAIDTVEDALDYMNEYDPWDELLPDIYYNMLFEQERRRRSMRREFYIAGVQFHQLRTVLDVLEEGMKLDVVPEPTNQYDPNAVRIEHEGVMLGYVPKIMSSEISAISEVEPVTCEIVKLNKQGKPWEMCRVLMTTAEEEGGSE